MRLIDADRAMEIVRDQGIAHPNAYHLTNYATLILREAPTVDAVPAADVAPVRHGRWEKQSGLYSCSECGKTCPYDVQADVIEYWACNYCPNCGAKMDGGCEDA